MSEAFIKQFNLNPESLPRNKMNCLSWKKYTTPVRSQSDRCGACYAFGTLALIESATAISNNDLHPSKDKWLSPQELVNCSSFYGNYGCSGGNSMSSLKFIKENGVVLESQMPYTSQQSRCSLIDKTPATFVESYFKLEPDNEALLKLALLKTPVVVAMNIDKLFSYSSGVFNDWSCDQQDLDHVVLVTGFGVDAETGQKYWEVKNSYGSDWGENGYFRVARRDGKGKSAICGMLKRAYIATIRGHNFMAPKLI